MIVEVHNNISKLIPQGTKDFVLFAELHKYLTIQLELSQYNKANWDGKKCYLNKKTGELQTGFLSLIANKLPSDTLVRDLRDNVEEKPSSLVFKLNKDELYEHQIVTVKAIIDNTFFGLVWQRGIVDACTNSGKTHIMASLLATYKNSIALIIVRDSTLYRQHMEDFGELLQESIGTIIGKKVKLERVNVVMLQSLENRIDDDYSVFQLTKEASIMLFDECQFAPGQGSKKVHLALNASIKLYFSGTALGDNITRNADLIGLAGIKLKTIAYTEMRGLGKSRHIKVIMLPGCKSNLMSPSILSEQLMSDRTRLSGMLTYILENPERCIMIAVEFIKHIDIIAKYLLRNNFSEFHIIHGSSDNRIELEKAIKENKLHVFITTLFETGANMPIDSLIYAIGGSNKTSIKQYAGRIQRLIGRAEIAEFIDFDDKGILLEEHVAKRLAIYAEEGYEIQK